MTNNNPLNKFTAPGRVFINNAAIGKANGFAKGERISVYSDRIDYKNGLGEVVDSWQTPDPVWDDALEMVVCSNGVTVKHTALKFTDEERAFFSKAFGVL